MVFKAQGRVVVKDWLIEWDNKQSKQQSRRLNGKVAIDFIRRVSLNSQLEEVYICQWEVGSQFYVLGGEDVLALLGGSQFDYHVREGYGSQCLSNELLFPDLQVSSRDKLEFIIDVIYRWLENRELKTSTDVIVVRTTGSPFRGSKLTAKSTSTT